MSKITVIGSMNMDLVISAGRYPEPGETMHGHSFAMIPGGKGANQAVACARMGAEVHMAAKVGNDAFGKELIATLKESGIHTDTVLISKTANTGVAIITVVDGENSIVLSEGANGQVTPSDIDSIDGLILSSDAIMLQHEIPLETIYYSIKKYAGKTKIFLNPAPMKPFEEDLLACIDYLILNQSEALALTSVHVEDEISSFKAIDMLLEKGVKYPIITMGSKGAAYFNGQDKKYCPAFKVPVVDTTAAGDTFCGALASFVTEGIHMDDALRLAQMAAALSTTQYGAQTSIPYLSDVEESLAKY